ncbi:hypothetical protein SLEP1_g7699 [Rubroshorea leprosula]|uniref:Uncharacterized protein n=1 Tax=Rubroshorea leprosula TaxID=152421 RepID=A0AAV5I7M2_9ROSI|nr:hypothetical protein SLEP1_g7699 [Rubroshorea leprosula]
MLVSTNELDRGADEEEDEIDSKPNKVFLSDQLRYPRCGVCLARDSSGIAVSPLESSGYDSSPGPVSSISPALLFCCFKLVVLLSVRCKLLPHTKHIRACRYRTSVELNITEFSLALDGLMLDSKFCKILDLKRTLQARPTTLKHLTFL